MTPGVGNGAIERLIRAVGRLSDEKNARTAEERELLDWARERVKEEGLGKFASRVGYDAMNLRKVLAGSRKLSKELLARLRRLRESCERPPKNR
jgi:hypothetical protein